MHLVGFIIRIYHDARSPERQISVWHIPLLCAQWKTADDGQRNCPKHVEFYFKNKFEKLVHIFGFIIRIHHDARSPERQISVWHIPMLCVQWKTPGDGQRNCPKHVEFYFKNKFEKLVYLVGFIIRIYLKHYSQLIFVLLRYLLRFLLVCLSCKFGQMEFNFSHVQEVYTFKHYWM